MLHEVSKFTVQLICFTMRSISVSQVFQVKGLLWSYILFGTIVYFYESLVTETNSVKGWGVGLQEALL